MTNQSGVGRGYYTEDDMHALHARMGEDLGKPVLTGEFGADMEVELLNDGPVTILIDTKNKE